MVDVGTEHSPQPRSQRLGVRFRRQQVIGSYIVDFLAPSLRLAIEVDGSCHAPKRSADARRTAKLARAGYRVLRLDAHLVVRDLPRAVALIGAAIAQCRR